MSGRGRGGGGRGGYKPPTGAQLFLQRSAQESGLDARNLKSLQDLARPDLFPDIRWHSSGKPWRSEEESAAIVQTKRSVSTLYLIRKSREIQHQFRNSVYFVRPSQESDIERFHKRPRSEEIPAHNAIIEKMGPAASCLYLPAEMRGKAIMKRITTTKSGNQVSFDELAKNEATMGGEEKEEDLDDDDLSIKDDGEEEEGADYTTNYYATDDESGGGDEDEGEPTF